MKEKSIILYPHEVRGVLQGRQTRITRIMNPQPKGSFAWTASSLKECRDSAHYICPYQVGMKLWCVTVRDIPGHEGRYGAGDDGHIYRIGGAKPQRLREAVVSGYPRISLALGRKRAQENRYVHEAVCTAFYGQRPTDRHEVRHLDGDRFNNCPVNLDWGTPEANWSDRKTHGRGVHEQHHNAKLSMEMAEAMRASGKTAWALAKEYGVSPKTVRNVLAGRTWVLTQPDPPHMPRWASRLSLEVTGVRVERVRDITEEDARAEGLAPTLPPNDRLRLGAIGTHREGFRQVWSSIHGPSSWAANPFCWVYNIKRVEERGEIRAAEEGV